VSLSSFEIVSQGFNISGDIGKIIRGIDGPTNDNNNSNDIDLSKKSKSTQALYLFQNGKAN
jgi:hypothetical protein